MSDRLTEQMVRLCTLLLAAATRSRLYGTDHRLAQEAVGELDEHLSTLLAAAESDLRLAVSGLELIAGELRLDSSNGPVAGLLRRMSDKGVGLVELRRGVGREELATFASELGDSDSDSDRIRSQRHIKLGTAKIESSAIRPPAPRVRQEALRVQTPKGKRNDPLTAEAKQLVRMHRHLKDNYEVRAHDFKGIVLSLLSRFSQQDNVFINLAEVRDHNLFTYLHTCNVATLSIGFGLALGLRGEEAYDLGVAALLHDVGKVVIPEEILDKPGSLTEEEWRIVQTHPAAGAKMLLKEPQVSHTAVVVAYEHHMHFDGQGGYPKRDRSPSLQSQLIAIADTFDALFGKRSYHARYDIVEALEILQSDSGTIYNPELVDHFSRFVTRNMESFDWGA